MKRVFLDYNATCPPLAEAIEAFARTAREAGGNPSSLHWSGRAARKALEDAREALAAFVGADPGEIVLTSGATEANNLAIAGVLAEAPRGEIVISAIEHPSVREAAKAWAARFGHRVVEVPPERNGRISAERFCAAVSSSTRLACLMWANNETGVIQPVEEVVSALAARGIPVLVDGVQALGKIPVDVHALGADFVSFSAHKIGGVKGVGALFVRRGMRLAPLLAGGGQERGRRSGTENPPGAAAFAAALGRVDFAACASLRAHLEARLKAAFGEDVMIFGEDAPRLANTTMFGIRGMDGETLLMQMDLAGFAVSAGSACASGKHEPSHVLAAMRAPRAYAHGAIRVSLGPGVRSEDLDAFVDALEKARERLKLMAGWG